ncbi:MAG TPA: hypothetical protein VI997_05650 [Candidatus Thermoplasmatota archaeon]|nr:hypothetical protein [Candidatus Thermoplasmatota archaeon]
MFARALVILMLVAIPIAGLAAGHISPDDYVTCTGGENYAVPSGQVFYPSKAHASLAPADRTDEEVPTAPASARVNTFYVVASQTPGDYSDVSATGKWRDADRAYPVSVWKETNLKSNLQTTMFECKYLDGHAYAGSDPVFASRAPDSGVAPPTP